MSIWKLGLTLAIVWIVLAALGNAVGRLLEAREEARRERIRRKNQQNWQGRP